MKVADLKKLVNRLNNNDEIYLADRIDYLPNGLVILDADRNEFIDFLPIDCVPSEHQNKMVPGRVELDSLSNFLMGDPVSAVVLVGGDPISLDQYYDLLMECCNCKGINGLYVERKDMQLLVETARDDDQNFLLAIASHEQFLEAAKACIFDGSVKIRIFKVGAADFVNLSCYELNTVELNAVLTNWENYKPTTEE